MARLSRKTFFKLVIRFLFLFFLIIALLLFLRIENWALFIDESTQQNWTLIENPFCISHNSGGKDEAFEFIPAATVDKWAKTEFLIVFGIPSVDNDGRRRRRDLQRATCWTFPGVATRANGHSGSLLVLYALAPHPAHGFALSESLRLEAAQWHDIVHLPVNEGRVTTNKKIGGPGNWGNEAEIGMSKKTFFWLQIALHAFPLAVYLGKCDDDIFMNVPQYLADLRLLPRQRIYWGACLLLSVLKNKQMEHVDVTYMGGYSVTLARDAAEAIVSYEPLRRIVSLPYSKERELDFLVLNMNAEDVMMGRALKESGYPAIWVADKWDCRFYYAEDKSSPRNVSEHSVVAHHLRDDEYHSYMSYFIDRGVNIQNTSIYKQSETFYWVKCPIK